MQRSYSNVCEVFSHCVKHMDYVDICVLDVCAFVFAVIPFECTTSLLRIPVSVKRAKTRRENTIVNTSNSVNGDAISLRLFPQLRVNRKQVKGTITYFPTKVTSSPITHTELKLHSSTYPGGLQEQL